MSFETGGAFTAAFDLDAPVAPRVTVRDLVEFVASLTRRGCTPYESEGVSRLLEIVSPLSFVRMTLMGDGNFIMPGDAARLARRMPFLSGGEASAVTREFGGEELSLPSADRLIRTCRAKLVRLLREDGISAREIGRRVGITPRRVRMIAPVPRRAARRG